MALSQAEIEIIRRDVKEACDKTGCNRGTMQTSLKNIDFNAFYWVDFSEKGKNIKIFLYKDEQKFYLE